MTTMTAVAPKTIKKAMNNIGLEDKVEDLLDQIEEIELDRRLKISEEQFKKGEYTTIEALKKETAEWVKNGFK